MAFSCFSVWPEGEEGVREGMGVGENGVGGGGVGAEVEE